MAILALCRRGSVWAGSGRLSRVAAALPLAVADPSIARRLRRWLANAHRVRA